MSTLDVKLLIPMEQEQGIMIWYIGNLYQELDCVDDQHHMVIH